MIFMLFTEKKKEIRIVFQRQFELKKIKTQLLAIKI